MTGRLEWARSAVVAAARFVAALVLAGLVQAGYEASGHAGRWPFWLAAATAAGVAVLLWLVRRPIDGLADRILLGRRAGGYELMRDLLARMSTALPVDEVLPRLAEATGAALHSPRAEVRVFLPEGVETSEVWPPAAEPDGRPVRMSVRHGGDAVGEIEVDVLDDAVSPFQTRQLQELLGPAGLALSTVRLTYALRARLVELGELDAALRASRDRLLSARAVEQRLLQADIERRVLPPLDSALALLTPAAPPPPAELSAAADHVGQALDAVRILSRGIYPPRLADQGLVTSLEGWAAHAEVSVTVCVEDETGALHGRPTVEAGVYFWAVTALGGLANRVARDLVAHVAVRDGTAFCRVSGHVAATASGNGAEADELALALRDRAEALDGTSHLEAQPALLSYLAGIPLSAEASPEAEEADAVRLMPVGAP